MMQKFWVGLFVAACAVGAVACTETKITEVNVNALSRASAVAVTGNGGIFSGPCGPQGVQLNAVVRDKDGNVVTGTTITYTSLTPLIATVSSTGYVTAVTGASGTAMIRTAVQGTSISTDVPVLVSLCGSAGTLYFTPQNPTGNVGSSQALTVVCSYTGCNPWMSSTQPSIVDVRLVSGVWTVFFIAPGTATICAYHSQTDSAGKYCGTATSTQTSSGSVTITPANPTINTGAGCALTQQFSVTQGVPVSWMISGTTASIGSSGLLTVTSGMTGSGTLTATPNSGSGYTTGTTTVTFVNADCASSGISVTVSPASFALTVGQQPIPLTCTVNNVPAGQSTACTWSIATAGGANCVTLTQTDNNHATLQAIAGCTQQIEIRAYAVADQSKYGSSVGTTSSGNVACIITWNGTTTGTITITRPNSTTATVSCTNEYGASFRPFGYSDHPEIFTVNGSSGVQTVNGVNWAVGPIFTLGPVAPGSGTFTVQADLTDKTVIASRPVVVQ